MAMVVCIDVVYRSFSKIKKKKSTETRRFGVLKVAEHDYDNVDGPRGTWWPGWCM